MNFLQQELYSFRYPNQKTREVIQLRFSELQKKKNLKHAPVNSFTLVQALPWLMGKKDFVSMNKHEGICMLFFYVTMSSSEVFLALRNAYFKKYSPSLNHVICTCFFQHVFSLGLLILQISNKTTWKWHFIPL